MPIVVLAIFPLMAKPAFATSCRGIATQQTICSVSKVDPANPRAGAELVCYSDAGKTQEVCRDSIKSSVGEDDSFGTSVNVSSGLSGLIGNIYTLVFFLVLAFTIGAIIFGGIQYSTAAGNSQRAESAKELITNAVIALVIVVGAGAILVFLRPTIFSIGG